MWKVVVDELEYAKAIYDKHRNTIELGRPLPEEVDWTSACLELLLVNSAQIQSRRMKEFLPKLKAFEKHYVFDSSVTEQVNVMLQSCVANDCKRLLKIDPLFWCLHTLCCHNFEIEDLANPAMLFGFLNNWRVRNFHLY